MIHFFNAVGQSPGSMATWAVYGLLFNPMMRTTPFTTLCIGFAFMALFLKSIFEANSSV